MNYVRPSFHLYILIPPVRAMQVPIIADPRSQQTIIATIKAGTIVEVYPNPSQYWLYIRFGPQHFGYIQASYARQVTQSEVNALHNRGGGYPTLFILYNKVFKHHVI